MQPLGEALKHTVDVWLNFTGADAVVRAAFGFPVRVDPTGTWWLASEHNLRRIIYTCEGVIFSLHDLCTRFHLLLRTFSFFFSLHVCVLLLMNLHICFFCFIILMNYSGATHFYLFIYVGYVCCLYVYAAVHLIDCTIAQIFFLYYLC